jgi:peptidoglycan hydrolase-like protein with peptidoglycan-binding domain
MIGYDGDYAMVDGYYQGYGSAYGDAAAPCDTKTVQTELNDLGFNAGVVDGFLGKNTYTALQMFALSSGTPYVWGQAPSQQLCTALAAAVAQKHAPPPPAPLPGPAPGPLPAPGPAPALAHKPVYLNPNLLVKKGGTAGWWAAQTTPMKLAIVGGGAVVLLGVLYATGVIGGKRHAKANRRHARHNYGSPTGIYEVRRGKHVVMRGTLAAVRWAIGTGDRLHPYLPGYTVKPVPKSELTEDDVKFRGAKANRRRPSREATQRRLRRKRTLAQSHARRLAQKRAARANPRRKACRNGKCPSGMQVQSLIFPKARFTQAQAKAWARAHGYRAAKVDATGSSYRLRQKAPHAYRKGMFRTIAMGPAIKAVVACPK